MPSFATSLPTPFSTTSTCSLPHTDPRYQFIRIPSWLPEAALVQWLGYNLQSPPLEMEVLATRTCSQLSREHQPPQWGISEPARVWMLPASLAAIIMWRDG